MRERELSIAASVVASVAAVCALVLSSSPVRAQARGVIIQIPDDVMPGAPRPTPPPAPAPPPAAAPAPAGPGATAGAAPSAVIAGKNTWHVINTANRTCLVLSAGDLKGGKDVRKLASLLPPPRFVVAAGACP